MTPELREQMGAAAVLAGEAINYEGVGTVEFLVDKHRNFYFMEMNTRIQVEHPVTEEVIDHDLIKEQIKIAGGELITGGNYFPNAHAIECRINAEDPHNGFRPNPGLITSFHSSKGHGRASRYSCICRIYDYAVLRFHDCQIDLQGSYQGRVYYQDGTGPGRIYHRRRQNYCAFSSAINER